MSPAVRPSALFGCSRRLASRGVRHHALFGIPRFFAVCAVWHNAPFAVQEPPPSLGGVVRNESGRAIEQAQVILDSGSVQRELRTDRDGRFRFVGVSPGNHRLRVLRIGFQPRDTTVRVARTVADVTISLQRLTSLSEVAVRARPTGVHGTVLERDSLRPVPGARVTLLGGRSGDTTDANGAFALGRAPTGTFMLRVSRDGYATRMFSVRVPRDSGVAFDIVLQPGLSNDKNMEMRWADLGWRINWKGVNSSFVGREELVGRGSSLEQAIRFAPSFAKRALVIDERACVFVNGVPRPNATIRDFNVEEIESIEVYGVRSEITNTLGRRWPRGSICGNPNARPFRGNRAQLISIWTRR